MTGLSYKLGKKGLLNTPGITYQTKKIAEQLLLQDAEQHHTFFNTSGFHNHLSHHILAAYDLGAPVDHIKKIYADVAKIQRPMFVEEQDKSISVDKDNWKQYLGNESAYGSYVKFFTNAILELGVNGTLEKYVFDEEVNVTGVSMLDRVMGGIVHPFIQIGYGAEFANDTLIATGLAGAAVHSTVPHFQVDKSPPVETISLFELLEQVNASEILKPAPYNSRVSPVQLLSNAIANGGKEEIQRLCAKWHISDAISDAELAQKSEEVIWATALLLFSTGKKGRKPRLDFFLMHLLTSSIFIRPLCDVIKKQENKAALLRAYIHTTIMILLMRGRPRINGELVMEFSAAPRPPLAINYEKPAPEAIGNPADDADYNPWPALIEGVRYHSDSHPLKVMRTLLFATQQFGNTPPEGVIGAFRTNAKGEKEEVFAGLGKVDGTIFLRGAGVMMDAVGWSGYGQKESTFDFTGLGWDAVWANED